MEKPIMVKSEAQTNGEIFLYYIDENGTPIEHEDGVVTTIVEDQLQQLQENYILEEIPIEQEQDEEIVQNYQDVQEMVENHIEVVGSNEETNDFASFNEQWSEEEIKKLLIFYIDNKKAFKNGAFTKRHLWSVACQMTLTSKNAATCQVQLHKMKQKYENLYLQYVTNKVDPRGLWLYYDLCHKAFHDDIEKIEMGVSDTADQVILIERHQATHSPAVQLDHKEADGTSTFKNKKNKKSPDEKVALMLEIFLQNKKEFSRRSGMQRNVWERMALQLGEPADYLHKKFLNYKRHYICMLEKKNAGGEVDWPYMPWFDKIFKDDHDFQRKYGTGAPVSVVQPATTTNTIKVTSMVSLTVGNPVVKVIPPPDSDWNETEKTVLVKYHYDCFDEFQDRTIPKAFLWNEVGRLLDKQPEDCKNKYEELKKNHLLQYTQKEYNLQKRKPIAIMFDNIIAQEVEAKFYDPVYQAIVTDLKWRTEKIDRLVQFFLDNIELFKDPICHFVCWSAIAMKLGETVKACKDVWNDLTSLYKSILDDKKEDPDLQIDWRYIDIFDNIFDYGLDTKLLEGYEKRVPILTRQKRMVLETGKQFKVQEDSEVLSDIEVVDIDENNTDKQTDARAVKLLEYYMKNKDKFSTSQKRKNKMWLGIAPELKMTSGECAALFRSVKQMYVSHIQREIDNPEKPVLWPYYALCKKTFGYRVLKTKLKNAKRDTENKDEWTPKEIKMLINFAGQNLSVIEADLNNASLWSIICKDLNKSATECRDMFLQLRKSYKQTQMVMTKNPESKVSWKYFKLFHAIYNVDPAGNKTIYSVDAESMEVDGEEYMAAKDDEFQCIIVIPEGQEISDLDLEKAKIIVTDKSKENTSTGRILWTKQHRMDLLNAYQDYVKSKEGKLISTRKLWKEIGKKLNRKPRSCQRKYAMIKNQYEKLKSEGKQGLRKIKNSPFFSLLEKIMQMKPKMVRPPLTENDIVLCERATYTDLCLPLWSVEKALTYYLDHVEEFVNPKYDKKQAWLGLAKASALTVTKAFKKINYLKQSYNTEIKQDNPPEFDKIVKEIIEKEFICKIAIGDIADPLATNENLDEVIWSERDTELLLFWYLEHREMFKDPKYNKNYLWLDIPSILNKSPLACSRRMAEIRSQYSSMTKENPEALSDWKYYDLCQKIYGTGKKGNGE